MTALAIDINDAGIAIANAEGVLAVEPGFALIDGGRIITGRDARGRSRLQPRQASNRYWNALSLDPGTGGADSSASAAEFAYAQLTALWQRVGQGVTDVFLVVPGGYRTEQLGLLLGLAQECGMPVRALVDIAAAASVRPHHERQLLYLDAGLYRVAATILDQAGDVGVRAEHALTQTGLTSVSDAFARRFADAFVRATRFNPFRHAETEQLLYDRLPGWLAEIKDQSSIELKLTHRDEEFSVTVERDSVLGVAAGFYRAVTQLVAQNREPGRSLTVLLSDRLAVLPGLIDELARLDDAQVECLPEGHAALGVLFPAPIATNGEQVKLLKRLPWREVAAGRAELGAGAARKVAPPGVKVAPPTHIVCRGVAYRVGAEGLLIGREADAARRTLVVGDESSGVSRAHCEVVMRDGELTLHDLSRYGTFVNERKISGEATLQLADVIRLGSPGVDLQAVSLEATE
jgi:hypothetical protein